MASHELKVHRQNLTEPRRGRRRAANATANRPSSSASRKILTEARRQRDRLALQSATRSATYRRTISAYRRTISAFSAGSEVTSSPAGVSGLLGQGRRAARHLAGWERKEATGQRDCRRESGVGRLQAPEAREGTGPMALTKSFRETVYNRAPQDGAFCRALLTEAVNAYLSGDEATGKTVLRDVINGTIGFEKLATDLQKPSTSLHRMLGPNGNPNTAHFFAILQVLQKENRCEADRQGCVRSFRFRPGLQEAFV